MEHRLIVKLSDNIISPLGLSSEENFAAVLRGETALCLHENLWNIPEPFVASLLEREKIESLSKEATFFEQICLLSAHKAINSAGIDPSDPGTIFILSTTKGNVELLDNQNVYQDTVLLHNSAQKIASFFKNPNTPIVVSNACISGVCAQIAAARCLQTARYNNAIVIAADVQSKFIISGFQSFKALSDEACRPFDINRKGLNLGEAAATIIYTVKNEINPNDWILSKGAIRNDANHISGPSRTGEGAYKALKALKPKPEELAFISAHGTATAYNDEMEAIAIQRAGLSEIPVLSLKGYFGHTMGAAGVLETILGMQAIENHCVIGTKGYAQNGTSVPLKLSSEPKRTDRRSFIKMLSGFGGCNAAILLRKGGELC